MNNVVKAVVLISGGLDSGLAAKIVQDQGVELIGVVFKSYFFDVSSVAQKQAWELGISLKVIDISRPQLEKVLSPEYGYGAGLNPCVDCHLLMIKTAYKFLIKEGGQFLVTGEVLGQRSFSQNRCALDLIDRRVGVEGLVLRPLSAKLLDPTIAEKKGWVERKSLYDIKGRSRKKQIELSKKFKLKNYTTPAGGCWLTDSNFSQKLQDLIVRFPHPSVTAINLLKVGRHFWQKKGLIIVGRNKKENETIKNLAEKGNVLVALTGVPGPTTLVKGKEKGLIEKAKKLTRRYANKVSEEEEVCFEILHL